MHYIKVCTLLLSVIILSAFIMLPANAGEETSSDLCMKGIELAKAGDYEGAIVMYDRAIALCPECAEAHYNKGIALHRLGQREEAVVEYDLAIMYDPDLTEAQYNRFVSSVEPRHPAVYLVFVLCMLMVGMIYQRHKKSQKRKNRIYNQR